MEKDRDKILRDARKIIDNFYNALSSVEKETREFSVEREECERNESGGREPDSSFRKIIFKNAPESDGECIKAETGAWTK